MTKSPEIDPARCPICGKPNDCGLAQGQSTCWCFSTPIPEAVLAAIPEAARNVACVCRECATRGVASTRAAAGSPGPASEKVE